MERKIKSSLCYVSLVLFLFCQGCNKHSNSTSEIAKSALGSTVLLVMEDANGQPLGIGSGFFVQSNQIATNFHVIEGAAHGTAKRVGQDTVFSIEGLTAMDEDSDLAIVQVSNAQVRSLPLADSDAVAVGDTVYVVGNPKGFLEGTFSHGLISAIRQLDTQKFFQLTAPISSGNSGGPVLNEECEVIGVAVAQVTDGQNLNFAVPSTYLKSLIDRMGTAKPLSDISKPLAKKRQTVTAETYYIRGIVKSALGLYKDAVVAFEISLRLKSGYPEAYAGLGKAKVGLGQYSDAIADYETAIQLKPDYSDAYAGRGLAKVELGQYTEAIKDYDTAIQLEPEDAEFYMNRARAKDKSEQFTGAIADYDAAILIKPDDAEIYVNRGLLKVKLENYADAINDYDAAMRLKPEDAKIYGYRGMANALSGQHFEAVNDYDLAILMNPDYADAYAGRGISKINLAQYASAIIDLNTAGRSQDSIAYFTSVIKLKPAYAEAYVGRGVSRTILSRYAAAIMDFNTAIEIQPDCVLAYIKRGDAKRQLEQYASAMEDYDTAIRLKPNDALAWRKRGFAKHYSLKQYTGAIEDYDIALRLEPDDAITYFYRGQVNYDLGRIVKAQKDFQTVLAFHSQPGDVGHVGLEFMKTASKRWIALIERSLGIE